MTAQSATSSNAETRQSASNRFAGLIFGRIAGGEIALPIAGRSGLRAALGFIAEFFIIREWWRGSTREKTTQSLIRGRPAGCAIPGHFTINFEDSRHRSGPGKSLRLLIAASFHLRAQRRIEQRPLQCPSNFKDVF